jgi:hypothetical protein
VNRRLLLLLPVVALATAAPASAQILPPPPSWTLEQNAPDPFCGTTAFRFGVEEAAHVQFAVWDAGATAILRVLVDGMLPAGLHEVIWDGRDDQGASLPNDPYSYRLTATVGDVTAFEATSVCHVACNVATESRTWGALKALYGL